MAREVGISSRITRGRRALRSRELYRQLWKCAPRGKASQGAFFAQTNLYVEQAQEAVLILATPNPCAAWVNRRPVYSRWLRPLYHELTDGFAFRIPIKLEAGWNSLLLKFLHDSKNAKSGHFSCRVEDSSGSLSRG